MDKDETFGDKQETSESDAALPLLIPQETHEFDFYGDILLVALLDGMPYVAVRPIATTLCVDWSSQYRRIQRDDILSEEQRMLLMTGSDGKQYKMLSIPLEMLHGWIFGVSISRVNAERRLGSKELADEAIERLRLYRRECFKVLWQAFGPRVSVQVTPVSETLSALEQVRDLGLAIVQMAESQMEISQRVAEQENHLKLATEAMKRIHQRLKTVEHRVLPYQTISAEQATEIRLAVQRLAEHLTKQVGSQKGAGKRAVNYYSGIFTEIYSRTGAPRYELIRQSDYASVIQFLEDWWHSAQGEQED